MKNYKEQKFDKCCRNCEFKFHEYIPFKNIFIAVCSNRNKKDDVINEEIGICDNYKNRDDDQ